MISTRKGSALVVGILLVLVVASVLIISNTNNIPLTGHYADAGGGWCTCTSCSDCTNALNDNTICSAK